MRANLNPNHLDERAPPRDAGPRSWRRRRSYGRSLPDHGEGNCAPAGVGYERRAPLKGKTIQKFSMRRISLKSGLLLGTVLGMPVSAWAQDAQPAQDQQPATSATAPAAAAQASGQEEEPAIVVTARRKQELLQDVPISITVFNQEQLSRNNVVNPADLATYTPSLSANNNFGNQNTTFAIRGFTQEIGTAPSVGVYFADVVTPRGASNGLPTGDGLAQGTLFDLQNVQVLKGPQGTLFGRNTTGGATVRHAAEPHADQPQPGLEGDHGWAAGFRPVRDEPHQEEILYVHAGPGLAAGRVRNGDGGRAADDRRQAEVQFRE